jgi:3-oxoadipate enol-lactonase
MPIATINGQGIAYDDTGGDGPAVILAHGFMMDRSMFEAQVAALGDRYRVITWDGRSCGDTEWDGAPFTYWDSAADCVGLLDHLGLDRAVVGGMSQGGFVSMRVALTQPDRVRGLILLDTQAGPEDPEVMPLYQGMIDEWVTGGPTIELAETTASIIIGEPELNRQWTAKWLQRPVHELLESGATLLGRDSLWDRLGEISAPALVVHGDQDVAVSLDKAQRLADGLSGCSGVVVVEGGTHSANMTHPAVVNAAIATFLSSLPA